VLRLAKPLSENNQLSCSAKVKVTQCKYWHVTGKDIIPLSPF